MERSPAGLAGVGVPLEVAGNSSAPASATTRHQLTAAPTVGNQMLKPVLVRPGLPGVGGVCAAVTEIRPGPGPATPHPSREGPAVMGRAWKLETVIQRMVGTVSSVVLAV